MIRKIHLYAGLIILVFLMMYFVTGYAMVHAKWFESGAKPEVQTQTQSLADFSGNRNPDELAAYLEQRLAIHGRLILPANPRQPGDALTFSIFHPGATTQVELRENAGELKLKTTRNNLQAILTQLHRIHGYGGGWLFNTWVFLNDLASFSCILFALTGVYLWWKSTKSHVLGIVCLSASCAYAVGMILYLLYAR